MIQIRCYSQLQGIHYLDQRVEESPKATQNKLYKYSSWLYYNTCFQKQGFVPMIVILGNNGSNMNFASDYVQFQLQETLGECRKLHQD